jgi:hypothetical protein
VLRIIGAATLHAVVVRLASHGLHGVGELGHSVIVHHLMRQVIQGRLEAMILAHVLLALVPVELNPNELVVFVTALVSHIPTYLWY